MDWSRPRFKTTTTAASYKPHTTAISSSVFSNLVQLGSGFFSVVATRLSNTSYIYCCCELKSHLFLMIKGSK